MKITVLSSSPRKEGTTALLVQEFIRGAEEAGHDVFRFDSAFEKIAPCNACQQCNSGKTVCVHDDSMEKLYPELLATDCIVFVTPLYYFGMTAQLKLTIDRLYSVTAKMKEKKRKAVLMAAAWEPSTTKSMKALTEHYKTIIDWFNCTNAGVILAGECGTREAIEKTDYPAQAYKLGKSI
ncbi:MAG: flavodoxin family protein [Oscillospiraceae bacterium]|nr:flavodoxin family protein [Oscillospiraceae bacterium]